MVPLSRRQRVLATTVLAAGAVASIATSQVWWDLEQLAPLPGAILDVAQPSIIYGVHAELTGPVVEPSGSIELHLEVSFPPDRGNPAALRVALQNDRDPLNEEVLEVTVSPDNPSIYLSASAFAGCAATPCVEDYTVWIDRTDLDGPPITPIMITGEVRAYVTEPGDQEAPSGSALTVTVEVQP